MPNAVESYETLRAAPADYRGSLATALTGGDSLVWTAPLSTVGATRSVIPVEGNPTLYARIDLGAAARTVVVYAGLWLKVGNAWSFLGVSSKQTMTAGAGTWASGRYVADELFMADTGVASHVEIRTAAPSSGGVGIMPFLGGSSPRGAGAE